MIYKDLVEICKPKQWKTLSNKNLISNGKYKVYGANGVIGRYDEYTHKEPALIMGCRGSCGPDTVRITEPFSYINGNAMCFDDISKDYDIKFLYYYFKSLDYSKIITGVAQPQITGKQLYNNVKIPFLKLSEQQSIVATLDKINELIAANKRQLELLDEAVISDFYERFVGKGFNLITIREVVDKEIISAKKKYKADDLIKYIDISSVDNIKNIIKGSTTYKFVEAPSRAQQCLKSKDILVSTVRPNLKNIAIFDEDENNFVASSGFCVLRAKRCNPSYLKTCVLLEDFTEKMINLTTGASYPAIRDADILNYEIINAPIELQNNYAEFVEHIDNLKYDLKNQDTKLQELLNKKMDEHFGGDTNA